MHRLVHRFAIAVIRRLARLLLFLLRRVQGNVFLRQRVVDGVVEVDLRDVDLLLEGSCCGAVGRVGEGLLLGLEGFDVLGCCFAVCSQSFG